MLTDVEGITICLIYLTGMGEVHACCPEFLTKGGINKWYNFMYANLGFLGREVPYVNKNTVYCRGDMPGFFAAFGACGLNGGLYPSQQRSSCRQKGKQGIVLGTIFSGI